MANPPASANVKLLVHADGTDGSTDFADSSGNAHELTAAGSAQVDSVAKFGSGSALFAGGSDAISAVLHDDFKFGSGSFNIEFWARFGSVPSGFATLVQTWGATAGWAVYYNGSAGHLGFEFQSQSDTYVYVERDWSITTDTWYHVSISNDAGTLGLFADGVLLGTTESIAALADPDGSLLIGNPDFVGHLDELRLVKGEVVYTAGFTPPTRSTATSRLTRPRTC